MDPKRILVPTDFSAGADAAFQLGRRLAREYGADLHLLHIVVLFAEDPYEPSSTFPESAAIYRRLEHRGAAALDALAEQPETADLTVLRVQRHAVAAAPEILEYAADHEVDLIVLGTHGRRGIRRFLLGSVAEEVVRTARCPVLTVRAPDQDSAVPTDFDRILVAYDFSADADQALATARSLAARAGGSIDLVHVIPPPVDPSHGVALHGAQGSAAGSIELMEELRRRLEARFGGEDQPITTRIHVYDGHPALRVVALAEALDSDLVTVGCRGRTGLKRFLMGSISERIVRSVRCPVLTVHADSRRTA